MKDKLAFGFLVSLVIIVFICFFVPIGYLLIEIYKYNFLLGMFITGLVGVLTMGEILKD